MNNQTVQQPFVVQKQDEQILVVPRKKLFPNGAWQGLKKDNLTEYLNIIYSEKEFHPRSLMETDPAYKQIIPYMVFSHQNSYFLMQRRSEATEQRLKNKYSLGIGGHVREEDMQEKDIISWARREFEEEVAYSGKYTVTPLGLLNDDSNAVGEVHIGLVLLLTGDSNAIQVKSELKSGVLVPLNTCFELYQSLENWSQIVVDALSSRS